MLDVYWLEQTEADVPDENDWLSARECIPFNALRFAKRRADWRQGRWTTKRAVTAYLQRPSRLVSLADIEIRPSCSGAPEVFVDNLHAMIEISLTHRAGSSACAIAPSGT